MKDIADKVGVSTALVSYVLSGQEKEKRVGAEMAKQIRKVAEDMNYTTNQIARSLGKGSTKTIGLIVADIANPFFGTMARIVEDEANKYGYTVIIGSSDEDCEKAAILVDALQNRRVDGFIIVPSDGPKNCVRSLTDNTMPLVCIDRYITDITTNFVILDNFQACSDAINCLIGKGYKKIGMVAYKSSMIHMKERVRGYTDTMEANGLKENILVKEISHASIKTDTIRVMKELTQGNNKLDALLFATNALSIHGLYYILENNIRVPEDLAIIGFDGNEAFDFFYSPLTYIKQPIEEMAKESVRILMEQINGSKKIVHIMLIHKLIERKSCG